MSHPSGGSWSTADGIIYGTGGGGLFQVPGDGGEPNPLTTLNAEAGETDHLWPTIITDHAAVLFVIASGDPLSTGQLAVLDLNSNETTRLGIAGVNPRYVATGHVLFVAADGSLRAVAFDVGSLEVVGRPIPLLESVAVKRSGAAAFSVSNNGRLVYVMGQTSGGFDRALVWVDRTGREERIAAPLRNYLSARISPDGVRVAFDTTDQMVPLVDTDVEDGDIWLWDVAGGPMSSLTPEVGDASQPHWTLDGQRIVFRSNHADGPTIHSKAADGAGDLDRLAETTSGAVLNAIAPDGTIVMTRRASPNGSRDLTVVTSGADLSTSSSLLATEFNEQNAAVSPDGRWLAYESDESGQLEIYVRPYPNVSTRREQVSTNGGEDPVWARDGHELFFRQDFQLIAVPVKTDDDFARGTPEPLFHENYYYSFAPRRSFDVAADGRFLMILPAGRTNLERGTPAEITVVINWTQELLERVPVD